MKIKFNEVFLKVGDNLITKRPIRVMGLSVGEGFKIEKGHSFGGIDWSMYKEKDLDVAEDDGSLVILGIY